MRDHGGAMTPIVPGHSALLGLPVVAGTAARFGRVVRAARRRAGVERTVPLPATPAAR